MSRALALALALLPVVALPDTGPAAPADKAPVFPDEDRLADPAVPAEKGGKGFGKIAASLGWTTNTDFEPYGDPRAVKGGEYIGHISDYPNNFRPLGPQANTSYNYMARDLLFEGLLGMHPNTLEWLPGLATHWKKSPDGTVFSYRLNPNARWADGSPVTSEDVVASWDLRVDETLADASSFEVWRKFKRPVADGPYLVTVTCAKRNWRNFLYFSSAHVFPAKVLRAHKDAAAWVEAYNTTYMMGSGPYEGRPEDQVPGKSVGLRRRAGYWAEKARANVGVYNFDRITDLVVPDPTIALERFKKGDLNFFHVGSAREWVAELVPEKIQNLKRGLIQKRKIFNQSPVGFSGIALNMQRPPYDDVRVRKALTLLLDRKRLLKTLMYNQYIPSRSYWPGSEYENPSNPHNDYDPETALKLLAEAGWKTRNASGQLVNAKGEPLTLRLSYASPAAEKQLTMYQESLKEAGITLTLELLRPEQHWSQMTEKKFDMAQAGWGGLLFPNPETSYKSTLAKVPNNNNVTGVADPRIDALLEKYDALEIEQGEERRAAIREIDGILAGLYPYVLFWHAPYHRVLFWNAFGHPACGLTRTSDADSVVSLWWWDPEKAKALQAARKDEAMSLPVGETTIRFWDRKKGAAGAAGE